MAQVLPATVATNVTAGLPSASAQDTITVLKPRDGQTVIVDAGRFAKVKFGFSLTDVQVRVVGVDLILVFEDGSKIVLPSMALDLSTPEAPQLYFGDEVVPPEVLFSDIGVVQIAENVNNLALTNVTTTNAVAEADAQPQPQPTPTLEGADSAGDTRGQIGEPPVLSQAAPVTPPGVTPVPAGAAASAATADPVTFTSNGTGSTNSIITKVDDPQVFTLSRLGFGSADYGATAGSATQRPPSLAELRASDAISGNTPELRTEDSRAVGVGYTGVTVRLKISLQDPSVTKGVVTVSMPDGYVILTDSTSITRVPGTVSNYEIHVAKPDSGVSSPYVIVDGVIIIDLPMAYRLTSELATLASDPRGQLNAAGFYASTTRPIGISFLADGAAPDAAAQLSTVQVGVRAVASDTDLTYTDATGTKWIVLPDNPAGNRVTAGDGDNVIQAGGGFDTIDGGGGFDIVSYKYSGAPVSVKLNNVDPATVGGTGFARRDVLSNIEGIEGSAYGDTLSGNDAANSFVGGAGDDFITGGGGADTIRGVADTKLGADDADTMAGGTGSDVYLVSGSTGTIIETYNGGEVDTVIVDSQTSEVGFTLPGGKVAPTDIAATQASGTDFVENLTYNGTGRFTGVGNWLNNTIVGGAGDDRLEGGDGNDFLLGNGGDDRLFGDAGNDTLDGGNDGGNSVYGGAGNDLYLIGADASVSSALTDTSHVVVDDSGLDTIRTGVARFRLALAEGVENLEFVGNGAHSGSGNAQANLITGAGGADTLAASTNTVADTGDTLIGGVGNDRLMAADGNNDSLSGGGDNDTLIGANGADTLDGGTGGNSLSGGAGADFLVSLDGDDTLEGGSGDDRIDAGAGNNLIDGGAADLLTGTGADSIAAGAGADTIFGRDGADSIQAGAGANSIDGGSDSDTIVSGADNDTIFGQDGADSIQAGDGANSIDGGEGADTILAGANADTIIGGEGDNSLQAGEGANSIASGSGADTIYAGTAGDTISSGAGADSIQAGAGANSIDAGADADLIVSGDGNDTIFGKGGADNIQAGAGANSIDGGAGADTITSGGANDVILGGDDADRIEASDGANSIDGGAGADTIFAGADGDTIFGQGGADSILAGAGANSIDAGADSDTVVALSGDDRIEGGAGGDSIDAGAGNNLLYGGYATLDTGTGDDTIVSGTGTDRIFGQDGNDSIDGGGGGDSVVGGTGSDTIVVYASDTADGGADDDLFLLKSTATSSIVGGTGLNEIRIDEQLTGGSYSLATSSSGIGKLTYSGVGAFSLAGDGQANTITGGSGGNSLAGGGGNDRLIGGGGTDTLDGGTGADSMAGGAGNDLYFVDGTSDVVTELAGEGDADQIATSLQTYTLSAPNVEVVSFNGTPATGGFSVTGSANNETFIGTTKNDSISGGGGAADALYFQYELSADQLAAVTAGTTSLTDKYTSAIDNIERNVYDLFGSIASTSLSSLKITAAKTTFSIEGISFGTDTLSQIKYIIFKNAVIKLNQGASFYGDRGGVFDPNTLGATPTDDRLGETSNRGGTNLADDLYGGRGNDTYVFNNRDDAASEALSNGADAGSNNDTVILTQAFVDTNTFGNSFSIADAKGNGGASREFANFTMVGGSTGIENLVYQGAAAYSLGGNELNNVIRSTNASGGADTLFGADGNDTLDGGVGANSLIGGKGNDVFIINNSSEFVLEGATTGTGGSADNGLADEIWITSTASGGGFTLGGSRYANVENARLQDVDGIAVTSGSYTVVGDGGANILVGGGTGSAASLVGGAGNDTLISRGGADTLDGGDGNDSITGGAGASTLIGGAGNDSLVSSSGGDVLSGGAGNDLYTISGGDPSILNGGVTITGESAGTGNTFADTISTSVSRFDLSLSTGGDGLAGIEVLNYTGTGAFTGTGNDLANIIRTSGGPALLIGGGRADTLIGGDFADTLDGSSNAAASIAGVSNGYVDSLVGGSGNDWYIIDTLTDAFSEAGAGGGVDTIEIQRLGLVNASTGAISASQSYTLGGSSNVENLVYNGSNAMTLVGNGLNNVIQGGSGNDSLAGNTNSGTTTSTEADTLIGGQGDDTYFVDSLSDIVVENAGTGTGTDTVRTNLASYRLTADNVENLTTTLTTGASLVGSSIANVISVANTAAGGSGADTLDGGVNADTTVGDTLIGGAGDDWYILNSALDVTSDNGGTDTIEVRYNVGDYTLGTNRENLVYSGATAASLTGTSAANSIFGSSLGDTINGAGGSDTMVGGAGNDLYFVRSTADVVTEGSASDAGSADTIWTNLTSFDMSGYSNVEALFYRSVSFGAAGGFNFTGAGNALNNSITGGTANNFLSGGAGNDWLVSFDGADTLDGGVGADTMISGGAGAAGIGATESGSANDTYFVDSTGDRIYDDGGASDTVLVGRTSTSGIVTFALNSSVVMQGVIENLGVDTRSGLATSLAVTDRLFLTGNADSSTFITGWNNNDTLVGGTSADTLSGGAGADSMVGGAGNDVYFVENAGDRISEGGGTADTLLLGRLSPSGDDTITFVVGTGTGTSGIVSQGAVEIIGVDTRSGSLNGTEKFDIKGNSSVATAIFGWTNNDTLTGGSGADTLTANGGTDKLDGGGGSDTYVVASGSTHTYVDTGGTDTILVSGGAFSISGINFADTLGNSVTATSTDRIENLGIFGTAAGTLYGDSFVNTISGSDGADRLFGNGGADRLVGNAGNDILYFDAGTMDAAARGSGGGGSDRVAFTGAGNLTFTGAQYDTMFDTVEVIDFTAQNVAANVTFGKNDVKGIQGAGTADLTVFGNANDTIIAAAGYDSMKINTAPTGYDSSVTYTWREVGGGGGVFNHTLTIVLSSS